MRAPRARRRWNIRAHRKTNIRAILGWIRKHPTVVVADVAHATKLSKNTVKTTIDLLGSMNLVVSAGKGESTEEGGKRPELYRFNEKFGYVISIHVRERAIFAALTNLHADITELLTQDVTDRALPAVLRQITGLFRELVGRKAGNGEHLVGLVVALPGVVDAAGGTSIYSPHYPGWGRSVPFLRLLRDQLGPSFDAPIFVDCVNRYQAIAEREKGVARGETNFIIVDVNEGLGSGIVTHGQLMRGGRSLSGEIGHMTVVPFDGPTCNCGNRGCFEAMVSARRVREIIALARANGSGPAALAGVRTEDIDLGEVCRLAREGEPFSAALVQDMAKWFVIGLGNIIMVNDPDLIVLQGKYLEAGERFLEMLRRGLQQVGLPDVVRNVRIERSTLGEERGVIGGAAYAISEFFASRLQFSAGPGTGPSPRVATGRPGVRRAGVAPGRRVARAGS